MNKSPIGLFDSGVGGITIWREIKALMPFESTVYIADNLNAPYGGKSKEEIIFICKKNVERLISKNCKIIVVACNTATTNTINYLRSFYNMPFVGIEPAIKPASIHTKTNTVGVLATKGTLVSDLFIKTSETYASQINIITQNGDGLVELIEAGKLNSIEMKNLISKYLAPMIAQKIDYLVLGCTHYPLLTELIRNLLPPEIKIIDSGSAVAQQTKHLLTEKSLLNTSQKISRHDFYYTSEGRVLENFLSKLKNTKLSHIAD